MSDRPVDEIKAEANRLMESGEHEEAKALLKALIEQNPPSGDLYEDIIYSYLLGRSYLEAKELARRYEREFGRKPMPELSLESIEKEERKHQKAQALYVGGERKVFRRLSVWERGYWPRYLPWNPTVWQGVRIEPETIVLKKRLRTDRLKWEQIRRASLTKKRAFCGENSTYVLKVIVLETADGKTYKIDVSTAAPELENATALEQAIRDHLTLEEGELEERDASRDLFGGLLTFLIIVSVVLFVVYTVGQ